MSEAVRLHIVHLFIAIFFCSVFFTLPGTAAAHSKTLQQVRQRGHIICGISKETAGFSELDESGKWSGFEIDFCRALAVVVFGQRDAVKLVSLAARSRFKALRKRQIDVLVRNADWSLRRANEQGLRYVSPLYYEGTGLLVRRDQDIASAMELTGAAFCTLKATPAQRDIAIFFGSRNMAHEIVSFETWAEAVGAFKSRRCQVLSARLSLIAAWLASAPESSDYMILPEMIGQEPLGPVVRAGDEEWFEIVRWTIFALIRAEELGLTSQNIDERRGQNSLAVRQFLGSGSYAGRSFSLAPDWIYQLIKQTGNYGEVFARNFGPGSSLNMQRRLNHLWSGGGLLAVPTFR